MSLPPPVLSVAGSDNSAGAGIQADLKTMSALGVYGLTAVTCVVAEVPGKVSAIQGIDPKIVVEQVRLLFGAFPVAAIKTGMLYSTEILEAVADVLEELRSQGGGTPLVVDPVMRLRLRKALMELIDSHDAELAKFVSDGALALDSYKEYVELFARSLRETMHSKEGVAFLLESCGFEINSDEINLYPETRWRVTREDE
jgi:hypothetical protein